MTLSRLLFHRREIDAFARQLLDGVWRANDANAELWATCSPAYVNYYDRELRSNLITAPLQHLNTPENVIELVDIVRDEIAKTGQNVTLQELADAIRNANRDWLGNSADCKTVKSALEIALKLWLFTTPSFVVLSQPLRSAIEHTFTQQQAKPTSYAATTVRALSLDFSAKNLTRKGGFYLMWTSELSEHLMIKGKEHLLVFCHARILQEYMTREERLMYPDRLLEETLRTLNLLFPVDDNKTYKRVRKIMRKRAVDIEVLDIEKAMKKQGKYQLNRYPIYGDRLAEIQARYDMARARRLKQWWFDRRQRGEWATLWIAVVIFALTLFFGVISSVTGIMQVYASFKFR